MKREVRQFPKRSILMVVLCGAIMIFGFQSCRKDKEPLSNLTGISSFSIQGFEEYTFTIDQNALTISNVDSLPFETNPNLVAVFNIIEGSTIEVNGVPQQSGVTSNDFSNEVIYKATAEDGVTSRSYKVKVNIAQIDPNTVAWQRVTDDGDWGPYRTVTAGYFNNSHWVFGGQSAGFGAFTRGVHKSTDGTTWSKVTTTPAEIPLAERQTGVFGFQNKVWLVGGLVPQIDFAFSYVTNQVWSSTDGTIWTATDRVASPEPGQMWAGRERVPVVVFQDKMWIIGGNEYPAFGNANAPGTPMNDVWSSSDGTSWTEVLSNASATHGTPNTFFVARTNPAVFVHDNKIYVAGGRNASGTLLNDIWTSSNGSTWTQLTVTTPFDPVWGHRVVSYNGQLFMLGGYVKNEANADVNQNVLWISEDDGVTWIKADAGDPRALPGNFPGRALFNMYVHDNAIWIVGGEYKDEGGVQGFRNDTWKGALVK